jgi:hypothetical protein
MEFGAMSSPADYHFKMFICLSASNVSGQLKDGPIGLELLGNAVDRIQHYSPYRHALFPIEVGGMSYLGMCGVGGPSGLLELVDYYYSDGDVE